MLPILKEFVIILSFLSPILKSNVTESGMELGLELSISLGPFLIILGACGVLLEPTADAVEVKGMTTFSPGHGAFFVQMRVCFTRCEAGHFQLVCADGAKVVCISVMPGPVGDSVPLL